MQQQEGLGGRLPGAALPHIAVSSTPAPQHTALGGISPRGLTSRAMVPGLRCGGRLMVAASLGLRCGLAARIPASAISLAAFSTQPTVPKPGFAPGAPPPEGLSPPPPGTAAATAAATPKGGTGPKPPAPGTPPSPAPAAVAAGKGRWSALGWAIPLIGLPLIAAYYNYQKEFDKEWDQKVARAVQELRAARKQPSRTISVPPPPLPPATSPPPALKEAPPSAAPAAAAATAAASSDNVSGSGKEEAATQAAGAAPAPEPATPEPAAEAPVEPPAPAPEPQASDAADVILSATAASDAAASPPAPALAAAAAAAPPPPVEAPKDAAAPAAAPVAPTAAPATTGVAAPAPPQVAVAAAAALAALQSDSIPTSPLPSGLPPGQLGLEGADLSPLGLVRHAVTSAGGAVVDWSQWPERHAQAVADSKLVFEALEAVSRWHQAQMEEVCGELTGQRARNEQLQAAGEAAVARFKALLRQFTESAKEVLELEVRQAEKRTRLEMEQVRLAEARQRHEALEQLRLALGALSIAHETRVRQAAASQSGHELAAGAAAVAAAAESGAPLGQAAAALRGLAAADPLVGAVVGALPAGPVATRSELLHQFRRLRRDLSALSYMPGERTGPLAVAVARLAAWLKADEADAVKVLGTQYGSGGVEAALARTEALLAAGQLPEAAELLAASLRDTAASALAAGWLQAVRARAAAEASVSALNAHATATWAALA